MQPTAQLESSLSRAAVGSSWGTAAAAAILVALAAIPRFWRLREQLFIQSDDAFHIVLVQRFAQDNIMDWSQARPMYVYLVGRLARIIDRSAFFPAEVSVLSGVLLVAVVFFWARARFGLLAATGAGLVLSVSQLEIYFSKTSGPIAPAMLVVTLGYVCVSTALLSLSLDGRRRLLAGLIWAAAAGLLQGLSVTIHRAFLPIPIFTLAFLVVTSLRKGRRGGALLLLGFIAAALVPFWIAQVLTETHQPPSINHFGYSNQLLASFDQQNSWRTGPGGRGWFFFLAGFAETEGLLAVALAAHGVLIGCRRWLRDADSQCGHIVWIMGGTLAYSSLVSAGGGITVLRAIAPGLPMLAVLSGLALESWTQALWRRLASHPTVHRLAPVALGSLVAAAGLLLSAPVITAQTGYAEAVEVVRRGHGFVAAYDGDPWRVLIAPSPVILVGPKRADIASANLARDRAQVSGPCYLLLHHYEIANGQLLVPGAADLDLVSLGEPAAVLLNNRDRLAPARIEDPDVDYEDEVRVYRDPPPCREADAA